MWLLVIICNQPLLVCVSTGSLLSLVNLCSVDIWWIVLNSYVSMYFCDFWYVSIIDNLMFSYKLWITVFCITLNNRELIIKLFSLTGDRHAALLLNRFDLQQSAVQPTQKMAIPCYSKVCWCLGVLVVQQLGIRLVIKHSWVWLLTGP